MGTDDLLSVTETAGLLGIGRGSVNAAINTGSLPATRVGAAWVVRRADAETYRRLRGAQFGKAGRTKGINLGKLTKKTAENA